MPDTDALVAAPLDVYSPCALGDALTDEVVATLRATVVCGAANNQLAHPGVEKQLADRGILYAPDYVVNAGGLIQVADELHGFDFDRARSRATLILDTTREVFALAGPRACRRRSRRTGSPSSGWPTPRRRRSRDLAALRGSVARQQATDGVSRGRRSRSSPTTCRTRRSPRTRRLDRLRRGRLASVELLGQRCEVRLVSAVLQIASNLGLLRLCTAAPHGWPPRVWPAALWACRSELTVRGSTLTGGW